MIVLIPAFRPDTRLARLVLDLHRADPSIQAVVVDDGSGPDYAVYFDAARAAGADLVPHVVNRGKGAALRTGIARAAELRPGEPVVTANADGQHLVEDILAVGRECEETGQIVLGVRSFDGDVPFHSKFGNDATALAFRLATGVRLPDTQTGLRAFPAGDLHWLLEVPGDRYEYELSVLLKAAESGLPFIQHPIRTIYEEGNATSHFRPLRDSARIYAPLVKFSASSLVGAVVDYVGVIGLHALIGGLLIPVVAARAVSAGVNFALNRRVFHARRGTVMRTAVKYAVLALGLLGASYVALKAALALGLALWLAKPIVDVSLYAASYRIQRSWVFAERTSARSAGAEGGAAGLAPAGGAAAGGVSAPSSYADVRRPSLRERLARFVAGRPSTAL